VIQMRLRWPDRFPFSECAQAYHTVDDKACGYSPVG
jgi:hypothetical protein